MQETPAYTFMRGKLLCTNKCVPDLNHKYFFCWPHNQTSTFPIENVKLRVKQMVELYNFSMLGLYSNAGNLGDCQRSIQYTVLGDFVLLVSTRRLSCSCCGEKQRSKFRIIIFLPVQMPLIERHTSLVWVTLKGACQGLRIFFSGKFSNSENISWNFFQEMSLLSCNGVPFSSQNSRILFNSLNFHGLNWMYVHQCL